MKSPSTNPPSTQAETITVRRVLPATPERVFACWTEPAHVKNWFRPEAQLTTPLAEIDLRVGGRYRWGVHDAAKDVTFVCTGKFTEVDPPRRVSYTWAWENPEMRGIESEVTVDFLPHGEHETEVVVTHVFQDAAQAGHHEQGWVGCLNQLETLIKSGA